MQRSEFAVSFDCGEFVAGLAGLLPYQLPRCVVGWRHTAGDRRQYPARGRNRPACGLQPGICVGLLSRLFRLAGLRGRLRAALRVRAYVTCLAGSGATRMKTSISFSYAATVTLMVGT